MNGIYNAPHQIRVDWYRLCHTDVFRRNIAPSEKQLMQY